jgi:transcriptional regulator with XRE-family HTH domain
MRSPIEQYVIDQVRRIRTDKKVSQADIAYHLEFESTAYIGQIESSKPGNTESYNINHLNQIAKLLNCSPKDFWPENPL